MDGPIPTLLVTVSRDSALGIADRLNRRLGHDRDSWTAFAARCLGDRESIGIFRVSGAGLAYAGSRGV